MVSILTALAICHGFFLGKGSILTESHRTTAAQCHNYWVRAPEGWVPTLFEYLIFQRVGSEQKWPSSGTNAEHTACPDASMEKGENSKEPDCL